MRAGSEAVPEELSKIEDSKSGATKLLLPATGTAGRTLCATADALKNSSMPETLPRNRRMTNEVLTLYTILPLTEKFQRVFSSQGTKAYSKISVG